MSVQSAERSVDYIVARLEQGAPHTELPAAVFAFDFGEDGSVTIDARQPPIRIERDSSLESDCTVHIAAAHLELILRGRVSVGAGFMKFVRANTGDMELTIRITRILRAALAQDETAG
jgi:hypothetical protein